MSKRKYTRKQLRKPDEFISLSMRVWSFVREHAPRVLLSLGVAVVIVGAVWAWTYFSDRRAAAATEGLTRAYEIYSQPVVPMATKLPPSEDGVPRFKTQREKLVAAEREFTKALESSRGSLNALGLLQRAGIRYELGQHDKALEDYQKYLAGGGEGEFRVAALEGVGYCHEARKEWDKALEAFRKLPRDGERQWLATYHEARILAHKGDKAAAAKLLKQVVEKSRSRALQDQASDQLGLIESK